MAISRAEVLHVARLARLHLDEPEIAAITEDLDRILAYVARLDELDLTDVPPTVHPLALSQPLRADEPVPSLPTAEALATAPAEDGESFVVPRIL